MGLSREARISIWIGTGVGIVLVLVEPKEIVVRISLLVALAVCMVVVAKELDWVRQRTESLSIISGDNFSEQLSLPRLGFATLIAITCVIAFGTVTWPRRERQTQEFAQLPALRNQQTETPPPAQNGILPTNVVPAVGPKTPLPPQPQPQSPPQPQPQSQTGLRQRALELSKDILSFVAERKATEPSGLSFGARTSEEQKRELGQFDEEYQKWMTETGNLYRARFAGRIVAALQDAKLAGISQGAADFNCITSAGAGAEGNLVVIEMCGANIGGIADRLPQ